MESIRDFVIALPKACGVPDGLAEIYGELNAKLFDWEIANPDGALNRKNFESVVDRVNLGICAWESLVPFYKTVYARDLLVFAARTVDAGGGDWRGKQEEKESLLKLESQRPEISALMTVDQASVQGNWV